MGLPGGCTQTVTAAIGDTDQLNVIDLVVPNDKAYVVAWSLTTKTAGVGSGGTFTGTLKSGLAGAGTTTVADVITFDADAVAGTYHGSGEGIPSAQLQEGDRLSITTVKTGTVSTGAVLIANIVWGF